MSGAIPPLPQYAFMAWYFVKKIYHSYHAWFMFCVSTFFLNVNFLTILGLEYIL
jgi:hypothetical protein